MSVLRKRISSTKARNWVMAAAASFGRGELLVVYGQNEGRGAGLLLGEGGHVAEAGHPKDLDPLLFDGLGQDPDPGPAGIFGAEVLIDDDHGKAKTHGALLGARRKSGEV